MFPTRAHSDEHLSAIHNCLLAEIFPLPHYDIAALHVGQSRHWRHTSWIEGVDLTHFLIWHTTCERRVITHYWKHRMQTVDSPSFPQADDRMDDFNQLSESDLHVQLSEFVMLPFRLIGSANAVMSTKGLSLALK